ncbi:MAG: 3-hydroxyacyl-CoA dehydrogenase family protein, partial [bacterium]
QGMEIEELGILGCGWMGSRIAQAAANCGFSVLVWDLDPSLLAEGLTGVQKSLEHWVEKGRLEDSVVKETMTRLQGTTQLKDLRNCDVIIEAVVEDRSVKSDLFTKLNRICPQKTIFASNTSSLSVTELAIASGRPDRFIGLHFFSPPHVMQLVEIVRTVATDPETVTVIIEFSQRLGKTPILAKDNSGFIVNYLLVPYLLDAIRALERSVGTVRDIDVGMRLGCGYPMGPFTLMDFIGLDVVYQIVNALFEEYREARYAPPPLLRKMVLAGFHGMKTQRGFYDYSGPEPVVTDLGF